MIGIIKKDIIDFIVKFYKINPMLFDNQTDLFSYPMYLKARDVLYILFSLSQKHNIVLSVDMNNYRSISVDTLAEYLYTCKKSTT